MSDTYHGIPEANTLAILPHFESVGSNIVPTVVPVTVGALTSVDPQFGNARWINSWTYRFFESPAKKEFFQFWMDHNGPGDGFWLPSWVSDFTPTSDIKKGQNFVQVSHTTFKALFDNISDMSSAYTDPNDPLINQWGLMIWHKNGNKHFRGLGHVDHTRLQFWGDNLLQDGQALNSASWAKAGSPVATVDADVDDSPVNSETLADSIIAPAGSSTANVNQGEIPLTTGSQYNGEFYFQEQSGALVQVAAYLGFGVSTVSEYMEVRLDLETGTATVHAQSRPAGASAYSVEANVRVQYLDSGWWRLSITMDDYASVVTKGQIFVYPRVLTMPSVQDVEVVCSDFSFRDSGGIPEDISKSNIAMLSLVRYARFSNGDLDMSWLTDNSKVDFQANFSELFFEGSLE